MSVVLTHLTFENEIVSLGVILVNSFINGKRYFRDEHGSTYSVVLGALCVEVGCGNVGHRMRGAGCGMRDAGCGIWDMGCGI